MLHADMSHLSDNTIFLNVLNTIIMYFRVKVYGKDKHSGVNKVHWKLIMSSTGFVKMTGDAPNVKRVSKCYKLLFK